MKIETGNILDIAEGIICHQVNSEGVMGAGLALQIKNKWRKVYDDYMYLYKNGYLKLGTIHFTQVDKNLWVCNIVGQGMYGWQGRFTDYDAFKQAVSELRPFHDKGTKIYFPYGIGCGLAGGNWDVVLDIIEHELPNAIIVKL